MPDDVAARTARDVGEVDPEPNKVDAQPKSERTRSNQRPRAANGKKAEARSSNTPAKRDPGTRATRRAPKGPKAAARLEAGLAALEADHDPGLLKDESGAKSGHKALLARGLSGPDTPLRRMAKEVESATLTGDVRPLMGRWVELVFHPEPRSPDEPVVVFHHIRKTAGTSLKRTIERNFPEGSLLVVAYPDAPPAELRAWWEDLFGSMTAEEKQTLRSVASHGAGFCIDLVPGRAVGITMVRDPIDQVLSRWFFMGRTSREPAQRSLENLRELYEGNPHRKDQYLFNWFNPQARTLLEPHFDLRGLAFSTKPPPDANVWRARLFSLLSRWFLVGVQDRFDDSVQRFVEELGWGLKPDIKAPSEKMNPQRPPAAPLDEELAQLIRSANWLDVELHTEYLRAFGAPEQAGDADPAGDTARAPGYVIQRRDSDADPIADLRTRLDEMHERHNEESQALRLRLQTVELELARAEAKLGLRKPIKWEKTAPESSEQPTRSLWRRLQGVLTTKQQGQRDEPRRGETPAA
jgi:hypothetical protein